MEKDKSGKYSYCCSALPFEEKIPGCDASNVSILHQRLGCETTLVCGGLVCSEVPPAQVQCLFCTFKG